MTGLLLCNHIAIPIFVEYRIPIPTFDSSRLHPNRKQLLVVYSHVSSEKLHKDQNNPKSQQLRSRLPQAYRIDWRNRVY